MLQDVVVAVLLISGASMSLAAGIGLVRFPDLLSRMHAATKPQVLGLLLLLLALAVESGSWLLVPVLVLCWVFQLLVSPVSAHMVGRAGYRTRHLRRDLLTLDELDDVVACAVADPHDDDHRRADRRGADRRGTDDHGEDGGRHDDVGPSSAPPTDGPRTGGAT